MRTRLTIGTAAGVLRGFLMTALLVSAISCSPGTLPGSPSPVLVGGGGARYNGSVTYRRLAGGYVISEASQTLSLSLVMQGDDQITGRFDSSESGGTISGVVNGSLAQGTFQATFLVSSGAQLNGAGTTCEGRGQASGNLSGVNLTWNVSSITYGNCPGLMTSAQGQALAVSPIPGNSGNQANLQVTVLGSTSVALQTCPSGQRGYPFTVETAERAGISVTFDSTFTVEERRNFGSVTTSVLDMPFTSLAGGGRRTYDACSVIPGTYQAFFTGTDANGNRIRVASPVVTFGG